MVPIIELRGAIPVAVLLHELHPLLAFAVSVIGNLLPVPFIIIFIRKIFFWIRKHLPKLNSFIDRLEEKGKSKKDKVLKYGFWGLFIFVAVPLPGTGAWTGALIAAMMDMRLKRAFPSILLGVLAAGIVVTLLSSFGLAAYIGFSAS
ncbi:MAG: small multidrug export protein [Ruminococcaceae bacterium]|nr:small multidrug export protein [Oscillospiraceae bacterium]